MSNVTNFLKQMLQVVVKWNTTKTYSKKSAHCQNFIEEVLQSIGRDNIMNVPEALSISQYFKEHGVNQGGVFQKVHVRALNTMYLFVFFLPFKQVNPFTKKKTTFTTHTQIDNYVRDFLKQYVALNNELVSKKADDSKRKDPSEDKHLPRRMLAYNAEDCEEVLKELEVDYPADFALLKSFDRAHWMKIAKERTRAKTKKQKAVFDPNDVCEDACPFKDPALTGSIPVTRDWIEDDSFQQV